MTDARVEFGRLLREHREAAGLTQARLGRLVGHHHSLISKVEHGLRWSSLEAAHRNVARGGDACPDSIREFDLLLTAYERFDDTLGGAGIVEALESHLRLLMGWLSTSSPHQTEVLRLAGRYGYRAGWARFENGQRDLAMTWFGRALGWAKGADDHGLAADPQTRIGVVARAAGDQVRALGYARAAHETGAGRPWTGFLAAILEARAFAGLGERGRCANRLALAANLAGRTDPADAPWLARPYGVAMLQSIRAACYRDLAAHGHRALADHAVDAARDAFERTPAEMWPNRALFAARLADAHAYAGEPDAAAQAVEATLAVPPSSRNSLVRGELRGLRHRLLATWGRDPEVRELAHRLSTPDTR
ncbi:helix-turn-helix domain-containing protein [Amycolatopsis anabasis]|uniref:helix-turn-helix domain-containing protein n=1 Tax=Amycolatopsis anabasis TaxID=1840409 RepID=UPI001C552058|nr:helix-turn-helix transcriptional regulator [Amycolatopsis anabasis]